MEELEQYRIIEEEKKGKGFLIGLSVLIILLMGLVLGYYFVFLSAPKMTDKILNNLGKQIESIEDYSSKIYNIQGDFSFDSSIKEYETLNDYKIDYKVGIDYISEQVGLDLSVMNNKNTILDMIFYLKNGIAYFGIEDLTPTMLKVDIAEDAKDIFKEVNNENYIYFINVVFNSIKENITEEKLSRTVAFNEIENKLVTLKLNYLIDQEEYNNLKESIINSILNDEKAIEGYASIRLIKTEEAKKELQESLKKQSEINDNNISLYIDPISNKILKITALEEKSSIIILNEENIITVSMKEEGNEETIEMFLNKEILQLGIDMKIKNEETKNLERMNIILNLKEYNKENTKMTGSITYMPLASKDNEYLKIDFTYNYEANNFIEEQNLSKAKTVEELTDDELMDFYQSILEFTEDLPLDSFEI